MTATASADLFDTYRRAESLLASGDLKQSADLCQRILDADPEFAHGYHLMSALFKATGKLDKALSFSQMALARAPAEPSFYLRLGQIWFSLERWQEAAQVFEIAHGLEPGNPYHLLLWASACTQMGRYDEAQALFARARAVSELPEIDEHEGLCRMIQGDLDGAGKFFDKVIAGRPDHAWGYVHKGKLLMERKQDAEAGDYLSRALRLAPEHYEALHAMAVLSERQGREEFALQYALKAVQANPVGWSTQALLGTLLQSQGHDVAAEEVLRQANAIRPGSVYILHVLHGVLLRQGKESQARELAEAIVTAQPDNAAMRHVQAMLTGKNTDAPPPEYVSSLFDGYAERFDHHLQNVLSYHAPRQLADAVMSLRSPGAPLASFLDLGCGTGLAGEAFLRMTSRRVGVDLSEKMLEKARARGIYDELHTLDAVEYILGADRQFDLVVATDVLIYVGNLSTLMKNARNALGPGSLLAFTIEKERGPEGFRLQPTGRYTHRPDYVMSLAKESGYDMLLSRDFILRTENHKPVDGAMFVFKKAPLH